VNATGVVSEVAPNASRAQETPPVRPGRWRRRLLAVAITLLVAAVSGIIGIVLVYQVSLSPLRLSNSALRLGAANTQLIVQSGASPDGSVQTDLADLQNTAASVALLSNSPLVQGAVGRSIHVPADQIGIIVNVAHRGGLHQFNGREVQRVMQIVATKKKYQLTVVANSTLLLINIYAQANTGPRAARMANAAARALVHYTNRLNVGVDNKRFFVRQVGVALPGQLGSHAGIEAAATVAVLFFVGLMIPLYVGRRRLRERAPRFRATAEIA
jgi:hypothetical protein